MKNKIFILIVLAFIVGGCYRSSTSGSKDNHIELINNDNRFLGKWYSVKRPYPFGVTLEIDTNYYFIYAGGACDSRFGSKGEWLLNGDTLILNSFEPEKCYFTSEFGENCTIVTKDFIPELKTSIKGCKPETDTTYYLFTNEKFIIEDSVLTHIQKPNVLCPEIKDNFSRTNWWIGQ